VNSPKIPIFLQPIRYQRVCSTVRSVNGKQPLTLTLLAVFLAGGLFAAAPRATASPAAPEADVKAVVETIQSLSGVLDNLDAAAHSLAEGENKDNKETKVDQSGRPLKNTIAIITAGAAAGASIGAATKKGTQAIVIGAIAGAAAGLIYDRMTAEKKSQPEPAATGPAPATPEKEKQPVQPAPVAANPAT